METVAFLLLLLALGALITEAVIRADERYHRHVETLRKMEDEK